MKFQPVINLIGLLLCTLSAFMLIPGFVDYILGDEDWAAFLVSSFITLFVGAGLYLSSRESNPEHLELRQAFLLTNSAWISISLFGSLPFLFSNLNLNFIDAFFESTSGITTTGSTIIPNLEQVSYGILLWRALLQWLGGIGIIVMAVAILPMLSIGGMQLFKTESYETPDKIIPRAAIFASGISIVYICLLYTSTLPTTEAV